MVDRLEAHETVAPGTSVTIADEVDSALRLGKPVLALESAVITHGLPRPLNLEVARACEAAAREADVVPATIAVLDGRVRVGLRHDELSRLASDDALEKLSRHNLAPALARRASGGTTVAATATIAHRAGIGVLATGGIGGVHRGPVQDVSSDLVVLAETPIVVVCSGAKSLLDLPATLEVLETLGVLVLGYKTHHFPAFYVTSSGLAVTERVETAADVAAIARARDVLDLRHAVLTTVPVPADAGLASEVLEAAVSRAVAEAEQAGVQGPAVTPYVLRRLAELTSGRTLAANRALLVHNAHVGALIAAAGARPIADLHQTPGK